MYSYDVFPLGDLSLCQIKKGQQALNDISKIVDNKNNELLKYMCKVSNEI